VEDKGQSDELETDVTLMDNGRRWLIGVVLNLELSKQQESPPSPPNPPQISYYRRRCNAVKTMKTEQNRTHTKKQQTLVKVPNVKKCQL
jgi:hypothetical protein